MIGTIFFFVWCIYCLIMGILLDVYDIGSFIRFIRGKEPFSPVLFIPLILYGDFIWVFFLTLGFLSDSPDKKFFISLAVGMVGVLLLVHLIWTLFYYHSRRKWKNKLS